MVLIHAYQATSAEWIDLAAGLSGQRRVYALDVIGDAGHSTVGRTAIETPADMGVWLDTVLEGLGLNSAEICGHSYGAWIALDYALGHPARVDRVTLLDPTMCFGPLLPLYVIRALPSLLKGTAARRRSTDPLGVPTGRAGPGLAVGDGGRPRTARPGAQPCAPRSRRPRRTPDSTVQAW